MKATLLPLAIMCSRENKWYKQNKTLNLHILHSCYKNDKDKEEQKRPRNKIAYCKNAPSKPTYFYFHLWAFFFFFKRYPQTIKLLRKPPARRQTEHTAWILIAANKTSCTAQIEHQQALSYVADFPKVGNQKAQQPSTSLQKFLNMI